MRLEGLDRGLQLVVVDGARRSTPSLAQLAGDEQPLADERDARVGRAGLDRRPGRDGRPAAAFASARIRASACFSPT